MDVSRRGFFLWGAGVTAATAAGRGVVSGLADLQEATYEATTPPQGLETWVPSVCQQCPGGCGISMRIITGIEDPEKQRLVKIEGNPFHPVSRGTVCPKGPAAVQALYDPDRLRQPMKRAGPRGSGQWRPTTWDEAIDTVAAKLREIRDRGEPHTVVVVGGQYRGLMRTLWDRFLEAYGSPNHVSTASGCEISRRALDLTQGIPEAITYDLENTAYILSFGVSLLEAWWSPVRQARAFGHLRQGTPGRRSRIVQVDPRPSVTAAKADEWIPIRPGTDGALALGIAYVILTEELYDRDFVENWTFGLEEWRDAAGRQHEGFRSLVLRDYRPERVSDITGVPVGTIVRVARDLAGAKPAIALAEHGVGSHTNALYSRLAIHALNALLGSLEIPGGVVVQRRVPFRSWPRVRLDQTATRGLAMPRLDGAGTAAHPLAFSVPQALASRLQSGSPYPVNGMFLYYANPLFSLAEFARAPRLLDRIPFIVSFSPFLDESSQWADLVLPDHTFLERWQDDPVESVWGPAVLGLRQPALKPRYDTRHTGDVLIQIARRLGGSVQAALPWADFQEVLKGSIRGVFEARRGLIMTNPFEEARQTRLAQAGFWLPTYKSFDEFWSQLVERGGWWDPAYPFGDRAAALRTPSGRFEFFSQILRERLERLAGDEAGRRGISREAALEALLREWGIAARGDQVFLPHYEPPRFEGDEKSYPLHLVTYKPMYQMGTRTANAAWLAEVGRVVGIAPWESPLEINPDTARALGLAQGDLVWLESPVGRIKVRVRLHPGARPDVVTLAFGPGHTAGGRWALAWGANPNAVIGGDMDRLAGSPARAATRVRVSKAE